MDAAPATDRLLRAATAYEVAAALMHHQPAAAFRSLFVLHGYGADLIDRVSLAEVFSLDAKLEAHSDERRYVIDQLRLSTLGGGHRVIELAGIWPSFYCFARCSIRQFPVFFALRDADQLPQVEQPAAGAGFRAGCRGGMAADASHHRNGRSRPGAGMAPDEDPRA